MRSRKAGTQYYHTPGGHSMSDPTMELDSETLQRVSACMARIPQGLFVLTTKCEGKTQGILVSWVQQISSSPPMIMLGIRKGRDIVPMIHGGHSFGLSQLSNENNLLFRKFSKNKICNESLEATGVINGKTGVPMMKNAMCFLDCELIRHVDVDGDHDIYVGLIVEADVFDKNAEPRIHLRDDGLQY